MSSKAVSRGFFGGLVDKLAGRQLGLPPEVCSYTVKRVRIPLEDDVQIAADLYIPINQKPFGTLFVPTPYGIGFLTSLSQARVFAARGYQVLTSSCRGTFESGGTLEPFRNEAKDGHAIVAWMREQEWYTGSFGTIGGSYLGYNQWALLSDPPSDMKASVIWSGLHSMGSFSWGNGALASHMIAWADVQSRVGNGGLLSVLLHLRSLAKTLQPVLDGVPLLDSVDQYFQKKTPGWLRDALAHPRSDDAYFQPMDQSAGIEKANIPILLTSGWDDPILPDVVWQYQRLLERGIHVALTLGPWTHLGCQSQNSLPESFKWLEEHLGHRVSNSRTSPVRVFVTGLKEWRDLPKWPPPTTAFDLFLNAGKKLSRETPSSGAPTSTFEFDPAHPTPSVGVPLVFDNGPGRSQGDTALASRSDVLVFDSDTLKSEVEVCGKPVVQLEHSTDYPDADLWVVLSEVNASGTYSRTISEKYLRLPRERQTETITISLLDCAHRFSKGTKIRLFVAGGSHPRYIRNLGSGEDPVKGANMQIVQHTVRHSNSAISKLILPVTKGA
ncbi:hypothetical protein M409DRAFT_35939 [Zasmidium cellare ATCC 36951]|uniref:Xaa-Pro dipeptidyl-peptidase C-terminal domain-containing protein n=1 Tax=Zasmidium cellare ATCC 36951 TaxID=1080233 RepID=A0A6A6CX12_ZASCE|nr:uncharacterized protein M409DRAFT_35939 [Zasmidium cellare ATCC 36951]KAF2170382.1 hypothetical protein M409DRAFT_35939 [Zasmidium cellare ATCC 36951]